MRNPVCAQRLLLLAAVLYTGLSALAAPDSFFDIAPFALPNTPSNEMWFEEPRDIAGFEVAFDGVPPAAIKVEYQRKCWPETQLEVEARKHPMGFGWVHQDDWFNGQWQAAAISMQPQGEHRVWVSFQPLHEEASAQDWHAHTFTYRRSYALRVAALGNPRITRVCTVSPPSDTRLRVELDVGTATPGDEIRFNGYNAVIDKTSVSLSSPRPQAFELAVQHMRPAHEYAGDDGHVQFALNGDAFTISLASLEKQGPIWFREMGVYVTRADDPTTFAAYRERVADAKTIAQQVLEHPEQTLEGAHQGQPRPHLNGFNLGCALARQRFGLENNGDIVLDKWNLAFSPDPALSRFKNKGAARFYFGLETGQIVKRAPDPAPVMAYTLEARKDSIVIRQESFAAPLMTPILNGQWKSSDPMVALIRFRFENTGTAEATAELPIRYSQDAGRNGRGPHRDGFDIPRGPLETLTAEGGRVWGDWHGERVLRALVETGMAIETGGDTVRLRQALPPGAACEAVFKIPFIALVADAETQALAGLDFARLQQEVREYWRKQAGQGATLHTPVEAFNALHAAHPAYVMLSDFADDAGRINTSVGTGTYGNFSNESCMIVYELDRRGLKEEAERRLDLWVHHQGSVKQPGNFTDYDGMYFGAGGFECGSYNQHHGWVLWCLCEHYLLTHDQDWFAKNADSILAGADWIFRQRKNTLGDLPHSRGWERGFLPAGSLEDVTDFYYWLSTNALTWRGAESAARAFEAAGHPEAARVRREADAYKADLLRGFETMRQHTPLVRLRDGRWVPDYPSRLYRRGRETGWIRETLEGSIYLLISGLYDVNSAQAQWILDDFQDNRYITPPWGYFIPDFDSTWFARAGISMQPNLLAGLMPYLDRDEPEVYLWMFFNAWNSCYREESNGMIEHPMPVLGWSNNVLVKTSDEANAVEWLRNLFVYARGDSLCLGRALPRAWFAQEEPFYLRNVVTPFGAVSVTYVPSPGGDTCKADVVFDPRQAPRQWVLRFRHPEQRPIRAARVDGQPATVLDPRRGDVDLTGQSGAFQVEVEY